MGWLTNAATLLVDGLTKELDEALDRGEKLVGEMGEKQLVDSWSAYIAQMLQQAEVLEQTVKQFRYLLNTQPQLNEALKSSRLHLVKLTQTINQEIHGGPSSARGFADLAGSCRTKRRPGLADSAAVRSGGDGGSRRSKNLIC